MIEVTTNDFRKNLAAYFDKADEGQCVVVRRGSQRRYTLVPVSDDNVYFSPEMEQRINESIEQAKREEFVTVHNPEELKELFDNL